jgi:hypothetical protein
MDRDELHRLVDTLPEGALEHAKRVLEHLQVWPPQQPPEVERIQQENLERMRRSMRPGTAGTCGGGGSYTVGSGGKIENGAFSFSRTEDKTAVVETHRFHGGHEITIIERLRLAQDGKTLIYFHEITGPQGTTDRKEIRFDVG